MNKNARGFKLVTNLISFDCHLYTKINNNNYKAIHFNFLCAKDDIARIYTYYILLTKS